MKINDTPISARRQAWDAAIEAARACYPNDPVMQDVAAIITNTALLAYEKKHRELRKRKKP